MKFFQNKKNNNECFTKQNLLDARKNPANIKKITKNFSKIQCEKFFDALYDKNSFQINPQGWVKYPSQYGEEWMTQAEFERQSQIRSDEYDKKKGIHRPQHQRN